MKKMTKGISDDRIMWAAKKAHDNFGHFDFYQNLPNDEYLYKTRKYRQAWNLVDNAENIILDEKGNVDLNNPYVKKLFDYYDGLDWAVGGCDFDNPNDVSDLGRDASEKLTLPAPLCSKVLYAYRETNPWIEATEDDVEDDDDTII